MADDDTRDAGIHARDRLIFALDVPTARAAEAALARVHESVGVIKVGLELFAGEGPAAVRMARQFGKPVFLDLKILDIAETVQRTVERVAEMGVAFLTVHAHRKALAAAVRGRAGNPALKILAVTVLTDADLTECGGAGDGERRTAGAGERGGAGGARRTAGDGERGGAGDGARAMAVAGARGRNVDELVVARARMAADAGCDGVIASGLESAAIRAAIDAPLLIVTPGVRPSGQGADDHARPATPRQAIQAGADYVVVGRPIRDAPDPRAAAQAIVDEMQNAFDRRTAG